MIIIYLLTLIAIYIFSISTLIGLFSNGLPKYSHRIALSIFAPIVIVYMTVVIIGKKYGEWLNS